MRLWLVLLLALLSVPAWGERWQSEQFLAETDATADVAGRWVQAPREGLQQLFCQMNLTAYSGTGTGFSLIIQACPVDDVVAGTCPAGVADGENWAASGLLTAPGALQGCVTRNYIESGIAANFDCDTNITGITPAVWRVVGNEGTGDNTGTYTIDCFWD